MIITQYHGNLDGKATQRVAGYLTLAVMVMVQSQAAAARFKITTLKACWSSWGGHHKKCSPTHKIGPSCAKAVLAFQPPAPRGSRDLAFGLPELSPTVINVRDAFGYTGGCLFNAGTWAVQRCSCQLEEDEIV